MEEQSQSQGNGIFSELMGEFVKVVYNDPATTIMKGILQKADSGFIFVKGNYSSKLIAISKIDKIEVIKNGN
jgi:hypothetical protein